MSEVPDERGLPSTATGPANPQPVWGADVEFRILGPLEVSVGGQDVFPGGSKQRTVLAALLLARGRVLPDARLSALLWGEKPPATLNAQVYTYVSRIRKQLGSKTSVCRRGPGYLLQLGDARFDYAEFERLRDVGHNALVMGTYDKAAQFLRRALDLWRGPALADVTEFLADTELAGIEESHMAAVEDRIEADLALGQHFPLVSELTAMVGRNPLRERLRAQLMVALYRCDRQADALSVYQAGRHLLAEELGVDPGPALRAAHQAILTGDRPYGLDRLAAVGPGSAFG
ncbi:AfsR/SARP family transcriptional regulator [Solihabitans fulvus]|uniref:AfsR/SARP family transcriptional regulator n=2 Tax=Solihabitans fulvus TaxID=1892852 RepID=A0A5B2X324_9PSEU|nr:AfsR/SARP family transcriptional regulator [Solihabitans fulvus]